MAEKQTKAGLIREYLAKAEYAETGPTKLAGIIASENKGMKVTPQEVSTMKTKLRAGGESPATPTGRGGRKKASAAPMGDSTDVGKNVSKLLEAASSLGKEKAKQLLDVLA